MSVAIELLVRPRLLLLDEPTSGLDPGLQVELMDTLRGLSRQGMTVVCTTHTMDTLQLFDQLAVLGVEAGEARLVFHGTLLDLHTQFRVRNHNYAELFDRLRKVAGGNTAQPASNTRRDATGTQTVSKVVPHRPRPEVSKLLRQVSVVARRSMLGFWRDHTNLVVAVIQPLFLAALVVLSQHAQAGSTFVNFFLIISAIWLGMTLTVRELVRERLLYVRDRMACLSPDAYLAGKLVPALAITVVQTGLLYFAASVCLNLMNGTTSMAKKLLLVDTSTPFAMWVLFLAGAGGILIGLLISTLASTERTAVAMLPLAVMPQMLLSRVAYGQGMEGWNEPSPFAPIMSLGQYLASADANWVKRVLSILSLPMLSRPATAGLDMPPHHTVADATIATEWVYFILLLLSQALVLYVVFRWAEVKWRKQR